MKREEAIQWLEDIRNLEVNWAHDVAIDMAIEALSEPSKVDFRTDKSANIGTEVNDLISRADAIDAFENKVSIEGEDNAYKFGLYVQGVMDKIKALPSADRPTVIRSRTLMPIKDFKEWAKRIKEENPNAIVIPCDAEVISADRPQEDISEDGTLKVNVTDGAKVKRVLVCGDNNFGGLYYPDDRPQGEWKKKLEAMYGGSYCYFYMCSVCEEEQLADTNYCPNCGARMRGAE